MGNLNIFKEKDEPKQKFLKLLVGGGVGVRRGGGKFKPNILCERNMAKALSIHIWIF